MNIFISVLIAVTSIASLFGFFALMAAREKKDSWLRRFGLMFTITYAFAGLIFSGQIHPTGIVVWAGFMALCILTPLTLWIVKGPKYFKKLFE